MPSFEPRIGGFRTLDGLVFLLLNTELLNIYTTKPLQLNINYLLRDNIILDTMISLIRTETIDSHDNKSNLPENRSLGSPLCPLLNSHPDTPKRIKYFSLQINKIRIFTFIFSNPMSKKRNFLRHAKANADIVAKKTLIYFVQYSCRTFPLKLLSQLNEQEI